MISTIQNPYHLILYCFDFKSFILRWHQTIEIYIIFF